MNKKYSIKIPLNLENPEDVNSSLKFNVNTLLNPYYLSYLYQ